jgi:hypothetical protein
MQLKFGVPEVPKVTGVMMIYQILIELFNTTLVTPNFSTSNFFT